MRRIIQLSAVCLAAGFVSACSVETVVETENIPTAGVRFINAVPDTNNLDFRFIDQVENNAIFSIAYRNNIVTSGGVPASTQIYFKNARAGARHFKIFLSDTTPAVASTFLIDQTNTLEAGKNYTFLLWGYSNALLKPAGAPAMSLTVIEETGASPGSGQVALRTINASEVALDVAAYPGASPTTADYLWANIQPKTVGGYSNVTAGTFKFNVKNQNAVVGAGTNYVATDATALLGNPPSSSGVTPCGGSGQPQCDLDATPGTTQAGSAVTAIVFPRSVAGTKATQFTTPAITFIWDKRPPRTCTLC